MNEIFEIKTTQEDGRLKVLRIETFYDESSENPREAYDNI